MGKRGKERREEGIRRKEEGIVSVKGEKRVRTNEMGAGKVYGEKD